MSSGIEKLKRNETRIFTYGTAGQPDPPLVGGDPLFILASFRVWNVSNSAAPFEATSIVLASSPDGTAVSCDSHMAIAANDICWINAAPGSAQVTAVDISVPGAPVISGTLDLFSGTITQIQDVSVASNTLVCVVCTDFGGVQVRQILSLINGTNPAAPVEIAQYDTLSGFLVSQSNPVVIRCTPTTAFVLGAGRFSSPFRPVRLAAYNISNPLAVTQQGTLSYGTPTSSGVCLMTINAAATVSFSVVGNEFGVTQPRLRTANISNPAILSELSNAVFGAVTDIPTSVFVRGTTLYVTSGIGTATSKLFIFNVSNPAAPSLTSTITPSEPAAAAGLASVFVNANGIYLLTGVVPGPTSLLIRDLAGAPISATVVAASSSSLNVIGQ